MADDYGSDDYATDYRQMTEQQEMDDDIKRALEHAEQAGLSKEDLLLLKWASGSDYKPKGDSNAKIARNA